MAENVFAMALRMRNHATTTARNLKSEVKGVGNEAQRMGTKFGKSIKATRTSMGGLLAQMISLKQLIILAFAVKAIQRFGRFLGTLTGAYDAQEQAVFRLGETLAAFGNFTVAGMKDLEKFSGALQETHGESDDLIMTNMALLASYGAEQKQIKTLTPLLIDFAKAKGMDMKTAFDLAGKASVGYFGTLSRYGIILDETLTAEEKYAAFMQLLGHYKGTAITLTDTYAGKVKKLGLSYVDMKEPMGKFIENGLEQSGLLGTLIKMVAGSAAWFKKWQPVLSDVATKGFGILNRRLQEFIGFLKSDTVIRGLLMITGNLQIMAGVGNVTFTLIKNGLGHMADIIELVLSKLNKMSSWMVNGSGSEQYAKDVARAEKASEKFWDNTDRRSKDSVESLKVAGRWIASGAEKISQGLSSHGPEDFRNKMEDYRQELLQTQQAEKNVVMDSIKNREKQAEAMEKVFKLSKSMAQQFAMASRLEQEQTKFMLQKMKGMSKSDVGSLTAVEKKLIGKQGVLKEAFSDLFGNYASQQLGIENNFTNGNKPQEVQISMTPEASEIFQVAKGNQNMGHRQYERASA